ncbi:hypothetical protein AB0395_05645 [Streptosporangium sp. NPDC051023]|uniref:hypothetical protein n=1 Tax=Streptosporangium sp. NPDC051023 TaxID=3155410 RepID=UPI00344C2DDB
MSDILSRIPSGHERPDNAEPTRMASEQDGRWSRRRLLGTATGVATAAGLGALDLLPWSKTKSAAALKQWGMGDCRDYFDFSTICVPNDALYSSNNCNGSWHKNDSSHWRGCNRYKYWPEPESCDGRNAWRWTGRVARRKCSDGEYMYYDCGGSNQNITLFSICRTAI